MKMRTNHDTESSCDECGCVWKNTEEMYDLMLCGEIHVLCKQCADGLFNRLLRMSCKYNGRVKSQEDMQRIQKAKEWRNREE